MTFHDHRLQTETPNKTRSASRSRSRRRSRYENPRPIIWTVLLLGVAGGLVAGLYYTWVVRPLADDDIAPWQLIGPEDSTEVLPDRDAYIIAIISAYNYDASQGDPNSLSRAFERLLSLRLPGNDPIQYVADLACRLVRSGYVDSNSHRNTVRNMMTFYQQQGRAGCADQLLIADISGNLTASPTPIIAPTSTLIPAASKTPLPGGTFAPTDTPAIGDTSPTATPDRFFEIAFIEPFCSAQFPGVIEVRVRDRTTGADIPALPIRVQGAEETSTFYTGLKPERGVGYADFQMTPGNAYLIEMPGYSDPSDRQLVAEECRDTITGELTVQSYRVVFQGS